MFVALYAIETSETIRGDETMCGKNAMGYDLALKKNCYGHLHRHGQSASLWSNINYVSLDVRALSLISSCQRS